jgi:hypothetical protein
VGQRIQPRRIHKDRRALQLQVEHRAAVDLGGLDGAAPVQRCAAAQRVVGHLLDEARHPGRSRDQLAQRRGQPGGRPPRAGRNRCWR